MKWVTLVPGDRRFSIEDDEEVVLTAALRQGLLLPHGCRSGVCRSCKARLKSGVLAPGSHVEGVLTEAEIAQGLVLLCRAKAQGDLVIEANVIDANAHFQVHASPCRIQRIEHVSDDVVVLKIRTAMKEPLQFAAGQYIEFVLKDGGRRAFSIATPPHDSEFLELHVRHVAGGQFTDFVFHELQEGNVLRIEGPLGSFFLREHSEKPIVLVASGTGFAPIKSIVEAALHKKLKREMTLYWGGRRPKDLYMSDLAASWASENRHFKYVPVISDATPTDQWTGRTGFVHRAVIEDHPDLSNYQVYACGVPIMVDSAKHDFVLRHRLPEAEFFADSFVTRADAAVGR